MNVHIAVSQSTVPWSPETCRRPAIVTSSFESEAASSRAPSPTHAPNVASKFNLVRKLAGYKARTRRQLENHVPREVGSSTNPRPASKRTTTERNIWNNKTRRKNEPCQAQAKTWQGPQASIQKDKPNTQLFCHACETAKHHLNPSSATAKNSTFGGSKTAPLEPPKNKKRAPVRSNPLRKQVKSPTTYIQT